jgi:hypothetical protein
MTILPRILISDQGPVGKDRLITTAPAVATRSLGQRQAQTELCFLCLLRLARRILAKSLCLDYMFGYITAGLVRAQATAVRPPMYKKQLPGMIYFFSRIPLHILHIRSIPCKLANKPLHF